MKSLYLVVAALSVGSFVYGGDGSESGSSSITLTRQPMPKTVEEWERYFSLQNGYLNWAHLKDCDLFSDWKEQLDAMKKAVKDYPEGGGKLQNAYDAYQSYVETALKDKCMRGFAPD